MSNVKMLITFDVDSSWTLSPFLLRKVRNFCTWHNSEFRSVIIGKRNPRQTWSPSHSISRYWETTSRYSFPQLWNSAKGTVAFSWPWYRSPRGDRTRKAAERKRKRDWGPDEYISERPEAQSQDAPFVYPVSRARGCIPLSTEYRYWVPALSIIEYPRYRPTRTQLPKLHTDFPHPLEHPWYCQIFR